MFLSDPGEDAFHALKGLLLEMAQERDLDLLLSLIVERLAESSEQVALARIWLSGPGDACETCRNANVCHSRGECLHLAASAERPRGNAVRVDRRLDGAFRRIPIGAFRVGKVFASRAPLVVADARVDPHIARPDWVREEGIVSFGAEPLIAREEVLGVLGVFVRVELARAAVDVLRVLANHAAAAIASARATDQVARLRRELEKENDCLREVVTSPDEATIVGSSASIQDLVRQIDLVAPTDTTVLISGESGTGKELVAEQIHRKSRRAGGPFVRVNCAAIPRELYESEFFGHARGAFSGAIRQRVGRFEAAQGGTLFLDEVGEIPLELQGKLLRVLQESTFERVGETHSRRSDVRIVAATNRDLFGAQGAGRFRQDLYYRLNVFPIETPPLRSRRDDIRLLAEHVLRQVCRRMHRPPLALGAAELTALESYAWPGNVRELQNVLERAVIGTPRTATHLRLDVFAARRFSAAAHPPGLASERGGAIVTEEELRRFERENLVAALRAAAGRVSGRGGAAELLGLKPSTLASRLRKLGIDRSRLHPRGEAAESPGQPARPR